MCKPRTKTKKSKHAKIAFDSEGFPWSIYRFLTGSRISYGALAREDFEPPRPAIAQEETDNLNKVRHHVTWHVRHCNLGKGKDVDHLLTAYPAAVPDLYWPLPDQCQSLTWKPFSDQVFC